jgi:5-amino-6-(5-phosphoribosylamino)uracil reductase
MLTHLSTTHGVRLLLCEGGSMLFGALVRAGLCDELFLTISPWLAGGDGPPVTPRGPEEIRQRMRLTWALGERDSLYLRYALGP